MNYYIPDDILKKEKKRKIYFQNHEELDQFVLQGTFFLFLISF